MTKHSALTRRGAAAGCGLMLVAAVYSSAIRAQGAAQQNVAQNGSTPAARCRVQGRVTSAGIPLPGASVVVRAGTAVRATTSSDVDGRFAILFAPNSSYRVTVDLMAFATADREITLGPAPCDTTIDIPLTLRPKGEALNAHAAAPASADSTSPENRPESATGNQEPAAGTGEPAAGRGRGGRGRFGDRGGPRGAPQGAARGGGRFQALNVEADANAAAQDEPAADDPADAERLLPAGFTLDSAQASAVAITTNGDATRLDRGALTDRLQAIAGGQFDPATGQFAPGFTPGDAFGAPAGAQAGGAGPGGRGGRGAGRGGGGGGRGFLLGGRGARSQSPYQGSVTYTFSGSTLNAAPFQLNPAVPATQPEYAQNNAGFTVGGPVKIPGLYKDANRRTNFQLNYQTNRSNNVVDQYATVPTLAMRGGDFSGSPVQLVSPNSGQPFAGNRIPASAMDPAALALLPYIPQPNLPGDQLNYHLSTLAHTTSNNLSVRFTQNLSRNVPQGGRGGGRGRGFGGGRGGGFGGPGGRGAARGNVRGTNITLNAQLQVRGSDSQAVNIFPGLGGHSKNTSVAVPIGLTIVHGRTVNNISVNIAHTSTSLTNEFSGVQNVAGDAGIEYPTDAAADPLNWGVPALQFNSGLTAVRPAGASLRSDNRVTTSYVWSHPFNRHRLRAGVDYRFDTTKTESNANPRGTFTYTGAYSSGLSVAGATGADFADFLLGAPASASLQVGGTNHLHGKSFDTYIEDNWQKTAKLTFNLGLRYELALPYVEVDGLMANLDVAPGFTSVAPVFAGGSGSFTGGFPPALINPDRNNIGPRLGVAYRLTPRTVLRGGYSITFNPSTYASIARELVAQPPFAAAETVTGVDGPLDFETALLDASLDGPAVTNTYGVDRKFSLGQIQTWNATISRNLTAAWAVVAGYTGIKGTDVDLLSVPDRVGPSSLLLPASAVEPYTWESSGAHSMLNQGNFQVIRRLAHGVGGSASYTLSKSMDNSPSLGGGSAVAQDPQKLGAEWALSNFDRLQQFAGNLYVELPWGRNRRWLSSGNVLSDIFGDWAASFAFTAQSGTPLTVNVLSAQNVLQGARGALRADYLGGPITVGDPTTADFFNTGAFAAPAAGSFGDSGRNTLIGPGSHQLNAQLVRDIRLGGARTLTLNINAVNVLNTENWSAIGTTLGTSTFGQVLSVRQPRMVTINARFRF